MIQPSSCTNAINKVLPARGLAQPYSYNKTHREPTNAGHLLGEADVPYCIISSGSCLHFAKRKPVGLT